MKLMGEMIRKRGLKHICRMERKVRTLRKRLWKKVGSRLKNIKRGRISRGFMGSMITILTRLGMGNSNITTTSMMVNSKNKLMFEI